jgi:hypothetical protein
MTKAEATVRHAIRNAMASTSDLTGLRAGPAHELANTET